MVECTGLENRHTERYRGFESHPLCQRLQVDHLIALGIANLAEPALVGNDFAGGGELEGGATGRSRVVHDRCPGCEQAIFLGAIRPRLMGVS